MVTLTPGGTVWLCGCVGIQGGTLTVKVATALVTEPALFVTTAV
jgi:hypothetical protein